MNVETKPLIAYCNHCKSKHETENINEFRESGTYPPIVYFMCRACGLMAELRNKDEIPALIFYKLISKIAKERGLNECMVFHSMQSI